MLVYNNCTQYYPVMVNHYMLRGQHQVAQEEVFLPDDIIHNLIKYLPIHESGHAAIVSKKWQQAFATQPFTAKEILLNYLSFPAIGGSRQAYLASILRCSHARRILASPQSELWDQLFASLAKRTAFPLTVRPEDCVRAIIQLEPKQASRLIAFLKANQCQVLNNSANTHWHDLCEALTTNDVKKLQSDVLMKALSKVELECNEKNTNEHAAFFARLKVSITCTRWAVEYSHVSTSTIDLREMEDCNVWRNFAGARLVGASLVQLNLNGANFAHANLEQVRFNLSYLNDAIFDSANLYRAIFRGCVMMRSSLCYVTANYADFTNAVLLRADAAKANFSHANFNLAVAFSVDFSEALVLNTCFSCCQLAGAILDKNVFEKEAITKHAIFGCADFINSLKPKYDNICKPLSPNLMLLLRQTCLAEIGLKMRSLIGKPEKHKALGRLEAMIKSDDIRDVKELLAVIDKWKNTVIQSGMTHYQILGKHANPISTLFSSKTNSIVFIDELVSAIQGLDKMINDYLSREQPTVRRSGL